MRIGLDLDNTLINYSESARRLAQEERLRNISSVSDLRARLRDAENQRWQLVQSRLYTEGLRFAKPAIDSIVFLVASREFDWEVFLVSHKTRTTPAAFGSKDLMTPALEWLAREGIVPQLIPSANVFFCSTQSEKVSRIAELELHFFVDDLEEVLAHPDFPNRTQGLLYTPGKNQGAASVFGGSSKTKPYRELFGFLELAQLVKSELHGA